MLAWKENVHVIAQISGLIFHILHSHGQSLRFSRRGEKKIQGLIHVNKRAVEPATADLRTGRGMGADFQGGSGGDRVQAAAKRGSLHFSQIPL